MYLIKSSLRISLANMNYSIWMGFACLFMMSGAGNLSTAKFVPEYSWLCSLDKKHHCNCLYIISVEIIIILNSIPMSQLQWT